MSERVNPQPQISNRRLVLELGLSALGLVIAPRLIIDALTRLTPDKAADQLPQPQTPIIPELHLGPKGILPEQFRTDLRFTKSMKSAIEQRDYFIDYYSKGNEEKRMILDESLELYVQYELNEKGELSNVKVLNMLSDNLEGLGYRGAVMLAQPDKIEPLVVSPFGRNILRWDFELDTLVAVNPNGEIVSQYDLAYRTWID